MEEDTNSNLSTQLCLFTYVYKIYINIPHSVTLFIWICIYLCTKSYHFYFRSISDIQSSIYITLLIYWISKTLLCPDYMVFSCFPAYYLSSLLKNMKLKKSICIVQFLHHPELFLVQSICLMLDTKHGSLADNFWSDPLQFFVTANLSLVTSFPFYILIN